MKSLFTDRQKSLLLLLGTGLIFVVIATVHKHQNAESGDRHPRVRSAEPAAVAHLPDTAFDRQFSLTMVSVTNPPSIQIIYTRCDDGGSNCQPFCTNTIPLGAIINPMVYTTNLPADMLQGFRYIQFRPTRPSLFTWSHSF